jgi:hypothetical protein
MYTVADLELAQRHVREGEARIARQGELIAELVSIGGDSRRGEQLLVVLLNPLDQMKQHRDQIEANLEGQSKEAPP